MKQTIKISPEAAEELEEAAAWYEHEQAGLGTRLIDAFEHALELLKEPNPPLVAVPGEAGSRGVKRLLLHRFPFSMVVADIGDSTVIVALSHHSRRPGYWQERINP